MLHTKGRVQAWVPGYSNLRPGYQAILILVDIIVISEPIACLWVTLPTPYDLCGSLNSLDSFDTPTLAAASDHIELP